MLYDVITQRNSKSSGYKIDMLNRGESPRQGEEPGLEELIGKVVQTGKFECTPDFSRISELDAVTLAIQTPFANPKDLRITSYNVCYTKLLRKSVPAVVPPSMDSASAMPEPAGVNPLSE